MATRTVYITVRVEITNPNLSGITDEDVDDVISETDYKFNSVGDFALETEICELNEEF